jgi:3',5'-cyclic AMP phosphodiesterase CpdA
MLAAGATWCIAQLSDIHVVGERYGFRIESGRSGPQGNERLARVLARLDAIHAEEPLDLVLFTGDMTDAGLSTEWAEFLSTLACYPRLQERSLILPGNHDLNVVDRTNPVELYDARQRRKRGISGTQQEHAQA